MAVAATCEQSDIYICKVLHIFIIYGVFLFLFEIKFYSVSVVSQDNEWSAYRLKL